MRVYYRDAEVQLTSSAIVVHDRQYRLDRIEALSRRSRGMPGGRLFGQLSVLLVVAAVAVLGFGLGIQGHVHSGTVASLFGSTTGLVVLCIGGLAISVLLVLAFEAVLHGMESARRFGRRQELWVRYQGVDTLVVSTTDSVRFGKIYRALVRALGDAQGY
jgi:uncharacterized membrane protein YidH (DUF202 family)